MGGRTPVTVNNLFSTVDDICGHFGVQVKSPHDSSDALDGTR
jgi:hypothetical protein